MKRVALIALLLSLFVGLTAQTSHAQGDVEANITDPSWQVQYWNNTNLSGSPVVSRFEADPNYLNVTGSFASGVNADNFSARFEKYIDVQAGSYRFRVVADDGIRVKVDGTTVIDKFIDQPNTTYTADVQLTTGYHLVQIEYYERTDKATLQLQWGPVSTVPTNGPWAAQFWTNKDLSGNPTVSTTVNEVNFDWGTGAPIANIGADNFSARFTRTVNFASGTYRFTATADDGIRVFVAGRPVIDQWKVQAATTYTYDIFLPGGDTEVKVEYYDASGKAVVKVKWETVGGTSPTPQPQPGEVVVDNTSTGFQRGGSSTGWRSANEGFGGTLAWTRNNDVEHQNYNYARWYPSLQGNRRYEVFVYIPYRYTTTTSAKYWVSHKDGLTSVVVNQSTNGDKWVSLGTFTFQGTNADYVSLNDITGESRLSTLIAFDAMKWVPR